MRMAVERICRYLQRTPCDAMLSVVPVLLALMEQCSGRYGSDVVLAWGATIAYTTTPYHTTPHYTLHGRGASLVRGDASRPNLPWQGGRRYGENACALACNFVTHCPTACLFVVGVAAGLAAAAAARLCLFLGIRTCQSIPAHVLERLSASSPECCERRRMAGEGGVFQ